MNADQNELPLGKTKSLPFSISRRQRRLARSSWWFERMREVVDKAIDQPPQKPTTSPGRIELDIFEKG